MKRILLISGIAIVCCAAKNDDGLKLNAVKDKYTTADSISLSLESRDTALTYYYVGLEVEKDGQWKDAIGDVSNPTAVASKVRKLPAGQKVNATYSVGNTFVNIPEHRDKYRLKVSYGTVVTALDSVKVSNSFSVK